MNVKSILLFGKEGGKNENDIAFANCVYVFGSGFKR
jgi:hypothetical protein